MISSKIASKIEKRLPNPNGIDTILDKATSLKELGLTVDAVTEYEKLFATGCHPEKILPGLVACLSKTNSPAKMIRRIEEVSKQYKLSSERLVQLKFYLGLEIEKMGYEDLALDVYKATAEIDPENKHVKQKIDQIISKLTPTSRYDHLLHKGLITPEQLQKALAASKRTKKSVEFILTQQFRLEKEDIGKSLSLFYGCPFKEFDPKVPVPVELMGNLKKPFLLHDLWVPLSWGKDGVDILIDDPWDLRKTGLIRGLTKTKKIDFWVGIKEDIEKFISLFFERNTEEATRDMIAELDMIPDISFEEEEEEEELGISEEIDESSSQVVRLVDQVIVTALRKNASDIHIEPSPITNKTTIRFRLDGVCQEYMQIPSSMARGVLSRLKIMAGIDIAERRLPQDGKIKFRRKGIPPLDLRLATLPTAGGHEDAVLRLLAASGALKLDEMGLSERNLQVMKRILVQPYGLILAVGPTGSGKTTSLHSALGYINNPGIKI